jgi:hypothetical protein
MDPHHTFSNCGRRTTTGMPTIVYQYAALIIKWNIKRKKVSKNK